MSKELKTGIIVIAIIVAFFWGFNFLKGHDIFKSQRRTFKVEYNNVGGLNEASLVTINGLKVGQVENIDFIEDPDKKGNLLVEFSLTNDIEFSKNSIVKIYSPNPLAGSSLAIVPDYKGELAVSGDFLKGELETGLLSSIGERLDPIQVKLEHVLASADTSLHKINNFLDDQTINSLKSSIKGLDLTISEMRKTLGKVNTVLDSSAVDLRVTIKQTKTVTENLAKVSDTLVNANIGELMRKANVTLTSVNSLLKGMDEGKGSMGKLINDAELYNNLANMSKELEELLREMKLNPKRFVHFSIFGKKAKPYNSEEKKNKETKIKE